MPVNSSTPTGCLSRMLQLAGIRIRSTGSNNADPLPYRRKTYILSKAERAFYLVLREAFVGRYVIMLQVSLGQLVYVKRGTDQATGWRNRIDRKTVDFVLVTPDELSPLAIIELDDSTHQWADRSNRDDWVDKVCQSAGLPIVHIKAQSTYHLDTIRRQIDRAVETSAK